jgi:hypothetical protein
MVVSPNRRDIIAGVGALAAAGGIQANRAWVTLTTLLESGFRAG